MRLLISAIVTAVLAAACAPPSSGKSDGLATPPTGPKRISTVSLGDPGFFSQAAYTGQGRIPGNGAVFPLVTSGLTTTDADGARIPQLGTGIPSTSDGSWRVLSDGRMEITAAIKPGSLWHDGTAVTSDDLVFSVQAYLDKDSGMPRTSVLNAISGAERIDDRSVVVKWSTPYINADNLFSTLIYILPKHILEAPYQARTNLLDLAYWRESFVGTGPFKLREYQPNAFAVFDAFDQYVLGRPKIDEIEVKYISDPNTVVANVLAGAIDMVLDGIVSLEQAEEVAARWPTGRIQSASGSSITIYAQFLTPDPAVIANAQFRRALLMAQDRQSLVDSFQRGQGSVAHTTIFSPSSPEFSYIQKDLVKYPLEPRRSVEMIEGLGFTHGPDGMFRDAAGKQLGFEFRTIVRDPQQKMTFAIADLWRQVGVDVSTYVIPDQQASDNEYRANFPGLQLLQQNTGFEQFQGANMPLPTNRYVGVNKGRINDPEINGWVEKYNVTIPWAQRMQLAGQLIHRITDEVIYMPTIYRADAWLVANRVKNINGLTSSWNIHEWAVQ